MSNEKINAFAINAMFEDYAKDHPETAIAKVVSKKHWPDRMKQAIKRWIQRCILCGVWPNVEPIIVDGDLHIIDDYKTEDCSYLFPDKMLEIGVPKERYDDVIYFVMELLPASKVMVLKFEGSRLDYVKSIRAELARRFKKVDPNRRVMLRWDTIYVFDETKVPVLDYDAYLEANLAD